MELFCEVARRRSFSKAAEAQRVSQSSASQAVHALEEQLALQLVDRSVRPLGLTPAGKVFFDGCRKLLDGFRLVEDRVRRMTDVVQGRVRVAAIYSVGLIQMDACVRRFEERYPDAELELAYLHPDDVYDRVLNDRADLGLLSFPKEGGDFSCIPWQEQRMVLVVPPQHALATRSEIGVDDFRSEEFVAFTPDLRVRRRIDRWLKQAHVPVKVVHEFDNIETIKRAVEIGSGVTLLPEPTVRREVELGSLHALELTDADWNRPLGIIHRRNKSLTTVGEKFVELLDVDPAAFSAGGNGRKYAAENGRSAALQKRRPADLQETEK
ncbi:MAG: LysR family transcriptional regulator [Planctomycetaceae bacterium]